MNILHLSDMHIDDPNGEKEFLREGHFRDFFDSLYIDICNKVNKIDYLVITGDFINKANIKNFAHAKNIVNYLVQKLSIDEKCIGICCGNHDVIFNQKKSDYSAFCQFKDDLKIQALFKWKFVEQYILKNDIHLLTFNSLFYAKDFQTPPTISTSDIDYIMTIIVREKIPKEKILLILSHYPMILFNTPTYMAEETNWAAKHYWNSMEPLVKSIERYRNENLTLWFYGDGHLPDFKQILPLNFHIMTGMIGGDSTQKEFNKICEAKILSINDNNSITIHTFQHQHRGYTYSPYIGKWNYESANFQFAIEHKQQYVNAPKHIEKADNKTELISKFIEVQITNDIKEKKLYTFNKMVTSQNYVSLGWIDVNRLMKNKRLLNQCVEKAIVWLNNSIFKDVNINNVKNVIIGLDYWGSILANLISIRINSNIFCLAGRASGKYHTFHETTECISKEILELYDILDNIIIITNVISSGETICNIKEELYKQFVDKFHIKNWICISVISDLTIDRERYIDTFNKIGTFCGNLRIPVIPIEKLPDDNFVKPYIDLR